MAHRDFLKNSGQVALISYKGFWIPVNSTELDLINLIHWRYDHQQAPPEDERSRIKNGLQYVHRANSWVGYIKNLKTGVCREIFILPKPYKPFRETS